MRNSCANLKAIISILDEVIAKPRVIIGTLVSRNCSETLRSLQLHIFIANCEWTFDLILLPWNDKSSLARWIIEMPWSRSRSVFMRSCAQSSAWVKSLCDKSLSAACSPCDIFTDFRHGCTCHCSVSESSIDEVTVGYATANWTFCFV